MVTLADALITGAVNQKAIVRRAVGWVLTHHLGLDTEVAAQ